MLSILWGTIDLKFDFVFDDDTPVDMDVLYLSFLDLDGPSEGHEIIRLNGVSQVYAHDDTGLTITEGISIFIYDTLDLP